MPATETVTPQRTDHRARCTTRGDSSRISVSAEAQLPGAGAAPKPTLSGCHASECDILPIEEALAVRDRDFSERTLARMREIRKSAGTAIMVTHKLGEIRQTCERAIWLGGGRFIEDADGDDVIGAYGEA